MINREDENTNERQKEEEEKNLTFESHVISTEKIFFFSDHNSSLVSFKFSAVGHLASLSDLEIRRILQIYPNKSISISINCEAADVRLIYWRCVRRWQFYEVKIQSRGENVAEFVRKFIVKELEGGFYGKKKYSWIFFIF